MNSGMSGPFLRLAVRRPGRIVTTRSRAYHNKKPPKLVDGLACRVRVRGAGASGTHTAPSPEDSRPRQAHHAHRRAPDPNLCVHTEYYTRNAKRLSTEWLDIFM